MVQVTREVGEVGTGSTERPDTPVGKAVRIHPVFLGGVAVFLIAFGAFLGETLFITISTVLSIGVLTGALVWMTLGLITVLLGVWAGRRGGG